MIQIGVLQAKYRKGRKRLDGAKKQTSQFPSSLRHSCIQHLQVVTSSTPSLHLVEPPPFDCPSAVCSASSSSINFSSALKPSALPLPLLFIISFSSLIYFPHCTTRIPTVRPQLPSSISSAHFNDPIPPPPPPPAKHLPPSPHPLLLQYSTYQDWKCGDKSTISSPNTLPAASLIVDPSREARARTGIEAIAGGAGVAVGVDPDGASVAGPGFGG